jgi:hypothetical protein
MTSAQPLFSIRSGDRSAKIGNSRSDPLPRLLAQIVERAGAPCRVLRAASRPWASALFEGRRHVVDLLIEGADAASRRAHFAEGLGEAQWTLSGHFVADILIDATQTCEEGEKLSLSALSIEDW